MAPNPNPSHGPSPKQACKAACKAHALTPTLPQTPAPAPNSQPLTRTQVLGESCGQLSAAKLLVLSFLCCYYNKNLWYAPTPTPTLALAPTSATTTCGAGACLLTPNPSPSPNPNPNQVQGPAAQQYGGRPGPARAGQHAPVQPEHAQPLPAARIAHGGRRLPVPGRRVPTARTRRRTRRRTRPQAGARQAGMRRGAVPADAVPTQCRAQCLTRAGRAASSCGLGARPSGQG